MARTKQVKRPSSPGASPTPSPPKVRIVQPALNASSERTLSPTLPTRTSSSPSHAPLFKVPGLDRNFNTDSEFRSSPPMVPSAQPLRMHDAETDTEGLVQSPPAGESSLPYDKFGIDVLGRGVKKLMAAANKLRDLGIERLDLALPKICVVGDQSTGKSSLIEGISAIKVPRSEDTCTRCPLEITLQSSGEPWKCSISLVKKYFYDNMGFENAPGRLGPWVEKTPEVSPFAVVSGKEELTFWLSRAQLAVLNPRNPSETYRAAHVPSDSLQVPFSPNVVRLEISGPTTPNLSFFDLPGIIVQDQEQHVPQLVQELVREYIAAPDCIVLFTLPMNNDIANSNAGAMVQGIGAHNRTIGVVTKPDTLVASNVKQWEMVLAGLHYLKLDFGFWVVKNEPDPSVEHHQARLNEVSFFETNPLFSSVLARFRDRFGTSRLQEFLSERLTLSIRDNLPKMSARIDEKGSKIEIALHKLPKPPPGDIVKSTNDKISELIIHLHKEIKEASKPEDFFNNWRKLMLDFRNDLVQSFPTLDLSSQRKEASALAKAQYAKNKTEGQHKRSEPIMVVSDSDSDQAASSQRSVAPSTPQNQTQPKTPRKSEKKAAATPAKSKEVGKTFTPADIKSRIDAASQGFLGSVDPRVIQTMYAESTDHWQRIVVKFLNATKVLCMNLLLQAHDLAFRELRSTLLFNKLKDELKSYLQRVFEAHESVIKDQLRLEVGPRPLTINDDEYAERMKTAEQHLGEKWVKSLVLINLQELQSSKGNRAVTVDARKNAENEARALVDPYKLEIAAMAATRAYYECKVRVFTDVCNTRTVRGLFEDMQAELRSSMEEALGLGTNDANQRLRQLAESSPEDAKMRQQYEADIAALHKAKTYIQELLTDGTASDEAEDEADNVKVDAMEV